MHDVENTRFAMVLRHRGRPSTTTDADRARNYQDAKGNYALGELKPWHERVVDYMIGNPAAKIVNIAEHFGVTPQWIGRLLKTDAFVEYYEQRLRDHQDLVSVEIVTRMQSVATTALDFVTEKIKSKEVGVDVALDAADLALKGLGYTAKAPMSVKVKSGEGGTTNVVVVSSGDVAKARAKLQKTMRQNTQGLQYDESAYSTVTASLELSGGGDEEDKDDNGIEDAILIDDGQDERF